MIEPKQTAELDPLSGRKHKPRFNPKAYMYGMSVLVIVGMIVLMTIPDLLIDPTRFADQTYFFQWVTKCLILVGIEIPSMLLFEGMSLDHNKSKAGGLYQMRLDSFLGAYEKIEPVERYFSDYYLWLIPKENENNRRKYLMQAGLGSQEAETIAKYADESDLPSLKTKAFEKEVDGKKIRFAKVNPSKIQFVEYALNGEVDVKDMDYSKYLYAEEADRECLSLLQKVDALQRNKAKIVTARRVTKILSMVIFSAIWAMVAFDEKEGGAEIDTWMNLMSRLGAMMGGAITGWTTSVSVVKILSSELETKAKVLKEYASDFNDYTFVPETYEQRANREFEEEMAKEETTKGADNGKDNQSNE